MLSQEETCVKRRDVREGDGKPPITKTEDAGQGLQERKKRMGETEDRKSLSGLSFLIEN